MRVRSLFGFRLFLSHRRTRGVGGSDILGRRLHRGRSGPGLRDGRGFRFVVGNHPQPVQAGQTPARGGAAGLPRDHPGFGKMAEDAIHRAAAALQRGGERRLGRPALAAGVGVGRQRRQDGQTIGVDGGVAEPPGRNPAPPPGVGGRAGFSWGVTRWDAHGCVVAGCHDAVSARLSGPAPHGLRAGGFADQDSQWRAALQTAGCRSIAGHGAVARAVEALARAPGAIARRHGATARASSPNRNPGAGTRGPGAVARASGFGRMERWPAAGTLGHGATARVWTALRPRTMER
ncbi:hypothetical protein FH063_001492 [Azospirillum argentinense]|uniref:Uncharacterized protein n=1 Tax=Azospirillum argentinense TaxID=2970906 RepID=A0A5B0L270_9PROT|nr:hypothetical protein FH063_001492 [Azospirillum argentinense]